MLIRAEIGENLEKLAKSLKKNTRIVADKKKLFSKSRQNTRIAADKQKNILKK